MQPNSDENDPFDQVVTDENTPQQPADASQPVHWQANEYIHHDKTIVWYVMFGLIIIALTVFALLVLQSITFAILVPVMGAALFVYTKRPPHVLDYTISSKGLYINDQLFSFNEFKGFGVIQDGREYSIMLIPVKRFRLSVSVYFPEQAGEAIVDMLGMRLPIQELRLDLVDRVTRKLRI